MSTQEDITALRRAIAIENEEICQLLGRVLGYPIYDVDGVRDNNTVVVGDHIAITLATEAANRIRELSKQVRHYEAILSTVRRLIGSEAPR